MSKTENDRREEAWAAALTAAFDVGDYTDAAARRANRKLAGHGADGVLRGDLAAAAETLAVSRLPGPESVPLLVTAAAYLATVYGSEGLTATHDAVLYTAADPSPWQSRLSVAVVFSPLFNGAVEVDLKWTGPFGEYASLPAPVAAYVADAVIDTLRTGWMP